MIISTCLACLILNSSSDFEALTYFLSRNWQIELKYQYIDTDVGISIDQYLHDNIDT